MAIVVETLMAEDLELGVGDTSKTHPAGGSLSGHQISLTTLSVAGADGFAATATWVPGAIANAASVSTTISVSGAAPGDKVLASLTSLLDDGLIISAHVSAANTVRVTIANLTGLPVTLASGTLSVLAFRNR